MLYDNEIVYTWPYAFVKTYKILPHRVNCNACKFLKSHVGEWGIPEWNADCDECMHQPHWSEGAKVLT